MFVVRRHRTRTSSGFIVFPFRALKYCCVRLIVVSVNFRVTVLRVTHRSPCSPPPKYVGLQVRTIRHLASFLPGPYSILCSSSTNKSPTNTKENVAYHKLQNGVRPSPVHLRGFWRFRFSLGHQRSQQRLHARKERTAPRVSAQDTRTIDEPKHLTMLS